jgi:hypothetical protein
MKIANAKSYAAKQMKKNVRSPTVSQDHTRKFHMSIIHWVNLLSMFS